MNELNLVFNEAAPDEVLVVEETVACNVNATTEAPTPQLGFEPENFVTNLKYMGIGMLVIFLVIGAIILSTVLINKLSSKKD